MHSHLSQVAAKKKYKLDDARVKVTAHFHESGSVLAGTMHGFADNLTIEIFIDSSEEQEEIQSLLEMTHRACFTEAAIAGEMPIRRRHVLNGGEI